MERQFHNVDDMVLHCAVGGRRPARPPTAIAVDLSGVNCKGRTPEWNGRPTSAVHLVSRSRG